MANNYFICSNPNFFIWAHRNTALFDSNAVCDRTIDLNLIQKGDRVIGTLPLSTAAEVCNRGAEFHALDFTESKLWKSSIDSHGMEARGATLYHLNIKVVEFQIRTNVILVTDLAGASEWLWNQGVQCEIEETRNEVRLERVCKNTTIISDILSPVAVAEINLRGGNFIGFELEGLPAMSPWFITTNIMEQCASIIQGYEATILGSVEFYLQEIRVEAKLTKAM